MKWSRLFLSLLLVSVVSATVFLLVAHADELYQPETVTATETEEMENGQSIGQDEQPEPEESETQSEIEPDTEQDETETGSGTNDGQQGTRTTTSIDYIANSEYEYETLATLESIEYQLKIISGGVIIAALSFFCWLTIYLPIKKFMYV